MLSKENKANLKSNKPQLLSLRPSASGSSDLVVLAVAFSEDIVFTEKASLHVEPACALPCSQACERRGRPASQQGRAGRRGLRLEGRACPLQRSPGIGSDIAAGDGRECDGHWTVRCSGSGDSSRAGSGEIHKKQHPMSRPRPELQSHHPGHRPGSHTCLQRTHCTWDLCSASSSLAQAPSAVCIHRSPSISAVVTSVQAPPLLQMTAIGLVMS